MTRSVFGLGDLDRWVYADDVDEVLVNAGREVWIERADRPGVEYVGRLDAGVVDVVIERVLAPLGRRLDRASPIVDARLPDGTRVCAVLPPVAADGPCLAFRRFRRLPLDLDDFGEGHLVELLREVVAARCNTLVSGATSSGKTSLLNALAGCIPVHERIVTLEDTAELHLSSPHVLRLETRPASEGAAAIELSRLVRTALRLRPDRLVIGEIRGDESVDLLQALNTGHDGSLSTVHANGALDALHRLASLVVRSSPGWPLDDVTAQVMRSIDIVVHLERDERGRRIREVVEVGSAGEHRVLADALQRRLPLRRGRR
ncbi:MAG: CpaF family protein [Acidimicrobiales bacterium]|nr:CpaF family protein [Acidimicrobiales bacterium]MCB9393763.1 CpaF family protein [Acidimicrobiaceae bacterium]